MKASLIIVALGVVLMAAPLYAQAPTTKPPATPATQPPAQPAQAAPQPPRPFPEGAKIAFVNIQRIASESTVGKGATGKITALREKKEKELQQRQQQLEEARKKFESSGSVLSDSARSEQQKNIERLQVDLQRSTQDAQAEVEDLQRDLQAEFQTRLLPIIEEVRASKGLHLVFSAGDSGLVAVDPGLDLTPEVIKKLDTAPAPAATPPKKP